ADAAVRDGALVRLLLGASPAEAAAALDPGPWTVVHARGGDGTPFAAADLAASLGTALVETDATASPGKTLERLGEAGAARVSGAAPASVRLLLPASSPLTARSGWFLGASAPAEAGDLPAADRQAARALRRAEA
ncbi:PucR family transcriptional regulator, partial [Streptomyces sp. SID2131]|nr:PucR family transcriptional regulator [Streptomyces sp. SID2131]